MGLGDIHLTPEGYEEIRKEIKYLKTTRRKELSREIEHARLQGDISENAEYDAAKERQAYNEKKIAELEEKLGRAQIIDESQIDKNTALVGATVTLKDLDSGHEIQYTLTSEMEADFAQGKISTTSPVGKGLLGHKVGETVEIQAPARTLRYKITKIKRG